MYAGVEEGAGGAAEAAGGIAYMGFEGSTCRDTTRDPKPYFKIKDTEITVYRHCALQQKTKPAGMN